MSDARRFSNASMRARLTPALAASWSRVIFRSLRVCLIFFAKLHKVGHKNGSYMRRH